MSAGFAFIAKREVGSHDCAPDAQPLAPHVFELSTDEGERLLRIISQTWRIKRHYELFRLIQGDVQYFLPHQILIAAWGNFQQASLDLDVISALPGVRTAHLEGCNVDRLLSEMQARWRANGRQPMLLDISGAKGLSLCGCECALHRSLRAMRSIVVHGVHNAREGVDSLYLAANADPIVAGGGGEKLRFRIDAVICQIDAAFRRVASLRVRAAASPRSSVSKGAALSARELEILARVSEGRTNVEISKILDISTYTVKNHVQRIIKKLGAANRTEAVVKHRRLMIAAPRHPDSWLRRSTDGSEAGLVVE